MVGPIGTNRFSHETIFDPQSQKVIVDFDESCDQTIDYLLSADRQPGVLYYRLSMIDSLVQKDCKGVLDLGCGLGTFLKSLYDKFPAGHFVGVDHNKKVIQYAKEKLNSTNLSFIHSTIGNFFAHNLDRYTIIFFERVLHCMSDAQIEYLLDQSIQVVEGGGKIIIITPDFQSQAIEPVYDSTPKIVQYLLKHSAINPISPSNLKNIVDKIVSKYSLKIDIQKHQIVTNGFKNTEDDLCLKEIVENAVKDRELSKEDARQWLADMEINSDNVRGISDMYIFTIKI